MALFYKTGATLLALTLSAAGCGNSKTGNSASRNTETSTLSTEGLKKGIAAVPADAQVLITIASPYAFWDFLVGRRFLPLPAKKAEELDSALQEHLKKHLGLDLRKVQSIVGFATTKGGALLIYPVEGKLKGASENDGVGTLILDPDIMLVASMRNDTMVIGTQSEVRQSLSLLSGEGVALSGEFAEFAASQRKDAYLSISAALESLPLPPLPFVEQLTRVGVRMDSEGLGLQIQGDNATLRQLKEEYANLVKLTMEQIKGSMVQNEDNLVTGLLSILSYYNSYGLAEAIQPKVDGDTLSVNIDIFETGSTGMIVVAGVGVLAAVAVPSFMKYMKKSKTAEGVINLKHISHNAREYYITGDPEGLTVGSKSLPPSVGPTPALGTCCASGEKCSPQDGDWNQAGWKALDFAMSDPHYYSYEFVSAPADSAVQSFTAFAYGDLDCDGVYSTYSAYGEVINGELQLASDVIKVDPLE